MDEQRRKRVRTSPPELAESSSSPNHTAENPTTPTRNRNAAQDNEASGHVDESLHTNCFPPGANYIRGEDSAESPQVDPSHGQEHLSLQRSSTMEGPTEADTEQRTPRVDEPDRAPAELDRLTEIPSAMNTVLRYNNAASTGSHMVMGLQALGNSSTAIENEGLQAVEDATCTGSHVVMGLCALGNSSTATENEGLQAAEDAMETGPPLPGQPITILTSSDGKVGIGIDINNPGASTSLGQTSNTSCPAGGEDTNADSTNCPICMEPWTGEGLHRICCLACGHLFGRSCIRRWLKQLGKKNGKCPHCNRKAKAEDIRDLYVPSLTVIDGRSQQMLEELAMLRSRNEQLIAQNDRLKKEYDLLQSMLTASSVDVPKEFFKHDKGKSHYQDDRPRTKQTLLSKYQLFSSLQGVLKCYGSDDSKRQHVSKINHGEPQGRFELQEEFSLPGAKVFDMDAFSQMLLVAQKSTAVGGAFSLNKISLLSLSDTLVMPLPQGTGAVRDIRVAPPGGKLPGRLALVASLGKKVSLFSLESNNVVLTYSLQSPCWSCAWDPNEPNHVYAGLQDGTLMIFDLRQTSSPLRSLQSFCRQPVHTLHPVNECNLALGGRGKGILSACSSGVCFWDSTMLGGHEISPYALPCVDNHGICVALAYNQLRNVAVASFRGKTPVQQAEVSPSNVFESLEQSGILSQMHPQPSSGLGPLRAAHFPLVNNSYSTLERRHVQGAEERHALANTGGGLPGDVGVESSCPWTYGSPMFGYVSPVGMHRSAIVCSSITESSSDRHSMFAFGDEETHALMLWDITTLAVCERLKAHSSPILDVKSMNVGQHAFLGCTSVTTFQVYRG